MVTDTSPQCVKILHYHLFKNAGTSVDYILQANFPGAWQDREFSDLPASKVPLAVENWLSEDPKMIAYSSHTAIGPLPKLDGIQVFSLLFVRHPIDRIQSAYHFERKQNANTFGSIVASRTSFAEYVTTLLDDHDDRSLRNFQTHRLAQFAQDDGSAEYSRALKALSQLSFVGLVDQFSASVGTMNRLLGQYFPSYVGGEAHENRNAHASNALQERLAIAKHELGAELYRRLFDENLGDLCLFDEISGRFLRSKLFDHI